MISNGLLTDFQKNTMCCICKSIKYG